MNTLRAALVATVGLSGGLVTGEITRTVTVSGYTQDLDEIAGCRSGENVIRPGANGALVCAGVELTDFNDPLIDDQPLRSQVDWDGVEKRLKDEKSSYEGVRGGLWDFVFMTGGLALVGGGYLAISKLLAGRRRRVGGIVH